MTDFDTGLRIREKARDLFMQYGLRSVSMDDIAGGLGMSKKTIYQHYADKDELIVAVINEELQHNQTLCEQDRKISHNAIHEIFLALDMVVELFSTMNPSLIFDMQKYHPNAFLRFQRHKNDFLYNTIRDNLERGIKAGLYREDINLDIMAKYRVESMMLTFNPDFHTRLKYTLVQIEEELIIHFLYGLASPKGYKLIIKYHQERIKINNDGKKQM
ncbi:MAG: TetR/AcrR family transcriptional regulator [Ferruginibacter sp.]|nr:TetR/AcrR family transcriptional regulator [Ferruginibacter sp.]